MKKTVKSMHGYGNNFKFITIMHILSHFNDIIGMELRKHTL